MSKHKRIDLICIAAAVVMVLLTLLFLGGGGVFLEAVAADMPYVQKIFDTSRVHTVDIVAGESDWEEMLQNAAAEEYISCNLVIDGESFKNVAIRPKGNSSLSTVASSDSDRYSFKIEFDHYDKNTAYYGLDKLCLNNVIQDNTYLKDYLCYQMMAALGADSPLTSYVWITVNGEDWGLYIAAEAVEEAFAQREYGSDYGQIYKPDSMNMGGGGRGAEAKNGGEAPAGFGAMETMDLDSLLSGLKDDSGNYPEAVQAILDELEAGGLSLPEDLSAVLSRLEEAGITLPEELQQMAELVSGLQDGGFPDGGFPGGGFQEEGAGENGAPTGFGGKGMMGGMGGSDDVLLVYSGDDPESYANIFDNAVFGDVSGADQERLIQSLKRLNEGDIENSVNVDEVLRYFAVHNFVLNGDSYTGSIIHNYYLYEDEGILSMIAWDYNLAFGGMGMGMSVGGTDSQGATSTVNSPIDSPVASGEISERPMVAWIFEDEAYTRQYHEVMEEFISQYFESGYFETMLDETVAMISPYVEKDPTAFCTYEEFQKGAETLKEFCLLRAESVRGQLDGAIPSTSEGQAADSGSLIDASHISVSDMGTQGGMGGRGGGNGEDKVPNFFGMGQPAQEDDGLENGLESGENLQTTETPRLSAEADGGEETPQGGGGFNGTPPEGMPEGIEGMEPPGDRELPEGMTPPGETGGQTSEAPAGGKEQGTASASSQAPISGESKSGAGSPKENGSGEEAPAAQADGEAGTANGETRGNRMQQPGNFAGSAQTSSAAGGLETWLLLGGSGILLLGGLLFAKFFH